MGGDGGGGMSEMGCEWIKCDCVNEATSIVYADGYSYYFCKDHTMEKMSELIRSGDTFKAIPLRGER